MLVLHKNTRYYERMAEMPAIKSILIDRHSSSPQNPVGIITADSYSTREFDDGVAVVGLDSNREAYEVNVFIADTSNLYFDQEITSQVLTNLETTIERSDDGTARTPMFDARQAKKLHLSAGGGIRPALNVSFTLGDGWPPDDIRISYGQVEVRQNYKYGKFGRLCHSSESFLPYARAASYILGYLSPRYADNSQVFSEFMGRPRTDAEIRGRDINYAYMIAANHLASLALRANGQKAVFRRDNSGQKGLKPDTPTAYYSSKPGIHSTLGLSAYARISSPLRRAEDFINHGQLRQLSEGNIGEPRDTYLVHTAVTALNKAAREKRRLAKLAA